MVSEIGIGKAHIRFYDGGLKKQIRENNMRSSWAAKKTLVTTALLATFIAHSAWVQAAGNDQFATEAVKRARTPKPKLDKGYGETTKERDRRLLRECKGRPNAGACEGFAS
jgi:hypothetical protein